MFEIFANIFSIWQITEKALGDPRGSLDDTLDMLCSSLPGLSLKEVEKILRGHDAGETLIRSATKLPKIK